MPDRITELEDDVPDAEQLARMALLGPEDIQRIDRIILDHVKPHWQKVAMVVARVLGSLGHQVARVPDVFVSSRVRTLVSQGHLQSQGNLMRMRFSEVRLPTQAKEA